MGSVKTVNYQEGKYKYMSEYTLSEIRPTDKRNRRLQEALLKKEGIELDKNLDYSVGLFDEDYNLAATGSCFKNTLRCMAVDSSHQGEGLPEPGGYTSYGSSVRTRQLRAVPVYQVRFRQVFQRSWLLRNCPRRWQGCVYGEPSYRFQRLSGSSAQNPRGGRACKLLSL